MLIKQIVFRIFKMASVHGYRTFLVTECDLAWIDRYVYAVLYKRLRGPLNGLTILSLLCAFKNSIKSIKISIDSDSVLTKRYIDVPSERKFT